MMIFRYISILICFGLSNLSMGQSNDLARNAQNQDGWYEPVNRTLSIVAHVVNNCDGQSFLSEFAVSNMITGKLNPLFEPTGIQFELKRLDTIQNCKYDTYVSDQVQRTFLNAYHEDSVINLYIFTRIENGSDVLAGYTAGGHNSIFMIKNAVGTNSKVLPHLMGHFFGLLDTYDISNGVEYVSRDSSCTTTGDLLCDTEADVNGASYDELFVNCEYIGALQDGANDYYTPPTSNVMASWFNDFCSCQFTPGQYQVILENYHASRKRLW